jgi:transposase
LRSGAVCVQSHAGCGEGQLDQRAAERSYGIAERDLTPAQGWSLPKLRKTWNQIKGEVAPWWQANSKEAYNTGLDGLARALQNWSTSRSGERAGFPKFKTRHRRARSVRFTTGVIRVEADRRHIPNIRWWGRTAELRICWWSPPQTGRMSAALAR